MTDSEKFTDELIKQLEECVKQFYYQSGANSYESKTIYKSQYEALDNIASHNIDVYYNNHVVRFSYYPHVELSMAHSVLTCYVSLSKIDNQMLFYPLSQICGFLNFTPLHALTIPMILSSESMIECFECIAESLLAIDSEIKSLSYDQQKKESIFNENLDLACTFFKSEFPTTDDIQLEIDNFKEEWYENWIANAYDEPLSMEEVNDAKAGFDHIILRISNEAEALLLADKQKILIFYFQYILVQSLDSGHEAYMVGNYKSAIKKLSRLKNKTRYENIIISYMQNAKSPLRHVPESIYKNLTELYKNGIAKNDFKEAFAIVPAMIMFGVLWAPIFFAVYFIFYFFESRNAIYLLGSLENAPSAILPALIMGITMIYFNTKKFYKLFFRKDYQKLLALENATHSRSTDKFMKGFTAAIFICSIAFLFLTVHQNIKLTDTGFYDNTNFFNIKGTFYKYDDVDMLAYQQETPDGHGGTFPYPSHVILLKNGEKIDLSQFDSFNEKFLNVLKDNNVQIEYK